MASAPTTAEVGLSQLDSRLPSALPYGTRPDAMPPSEAPRKNGATIDEAAKRTSTARTCRRPVAPLDKAYAAPRTTIASTATMRATESVEAIEARGGG